MEIIVVERSAWHMIALIRQETRLHIETDVALDDHENFAF